ncbi:hypothetical protein ASF56_22920 [Methylobacterium sp. Leaf122]|nr:hypothetical protein [Methylobacterium sp. Leaf122]KQQ17576.1 hypothetical protein ASF56_22920 [Methylobacterium sp. Leaf122]
MTKLAIEPIEHAAVENNRNATGEITSFGLRTQYDPIVVKMIRKIDGAAWAATSRVWVIPVAKRDTLVTLLTEIATHFAAQHQKPKIQHRLVTNYVSKGLGFVPAGAVTTYSITIPYDDTCTRMIKRVASARWHGEDRSWRISAKDHDEVVALLPKLEERLVAAAEEREQEEGERDRKAFELAARRDLYPFSEAPGIGTTMPRGADRYNVGDESRIVTITEHGRPWRMSSEDGSGHPYRCYEGGRMVYVYHRPATPAEIETYKRRMAEEEALSKAVALVERTFSRVDRTGEAVQLGREPEGELLWQNARSAVNGYKTKLVLDQEGGLWAITYDGSDGGAQGESNLGWNTRGGRITPKPKTLASLRAATDLIAKKLPEHYAPNWLAVAEVEQSRPTSA